MTHPTLQHRRFTFPGNHHLLRGNGVHRAAGVRGHGHEHLAPGKLAEHVGEHRRRVVGADPQHLGGPPGVAPARAAQRGHPAVLVIYRRPGARELRRTALGKPAHTARLGVAVVQAPRVAVVLQVGLEHWRVHAAACAHLLQQPAHPAQPHLRVGGVHHLEQAAIDAAQRLFRRLEQHRVIHIHPRCERTGGYQGTRQVRLLAELERRVQLKALQHRRGGRAPGRVVRVLPPECAERGCLRDLLGQQLKPRT